MNNSAIDSFTAASGLVGGHESLDTQAEVEFALAMLELEPGSRVLDLPCGNGRHARVFGERGLRVTAVDIDADSLAIARRAAAHPHVEYLQLDARSVVELGRSFDAVVSLFSCIGYFETEEDDQAALAAMSAVLRPHGRLLLSTANGPVVARSGDTRVVFEPGELRIERLDSYDPQRRCLERLFLVEDKRTGARTEIHHRRRLYGPDEIIERLTRCGVTGVRCASDFGGAPLDPDRSPHAIYIGERQG